MLRKCALLLALAAVGVQPVHSAVITEYFSVDPRQDGWSAYGETNLFHWNSGEELVEVTWDSSKSNSYFALPLGTVLTRHDDFGFSFDLRLSDFQAGITPGKPFPFQLSVALINLAEAMAPSFQRGSGFSSPDLVEFSFFPDPGGAWQWGPSITAAMVDQTATNWSSGGFAPSSLSPDDLYHVLMQFSAADQNLRMTITRNGESFLDTTAASGANFTDFKVDHMAICSYSEAGQDPAYAGSLLAHGSIDNVTLSLPAPVAGRLSGRFENSAWVVRFDSASGWHYLLERTADLKNWLPVSDSQLGTGDEVTLTDTNAPQARAFYRVRASKP